LEDYTKHRVGSIQRLDQEYHVIDHVFRLGWLIAFIAVCSFGAARGAVVITADGEEIAGDVTSLEGGVLTITPAGAAADAAAKKLRMADVVSIAFSAAGSVPTVGKTATGPLVVDNDGVHNMKMQVGSVRLKAGKHEFHVLYFQAKEESGLRLSFSSPNSPTKGIPEAAFSHQKPGTAKPPPASPTADGLRMPDAVDTQPNLEFAYYEAPAGTSWSSVKDFFGATPKSTGFVSRIDTSMAERAENFGLRFSGYIEVPQDAQYTFYLTSDEGSQLYIGPLPPGVVGAAAAVEKDAATQPAEAAAVATGPVMQVAMLSGDKVTGRLVSWTPSEITLSVPSSEKPAVIAMKEVREVWRIDAPRDKAPKVQPGENDTALISKDNEVQAVKGVVLGVTGESMGFRYNDEERKIALDRLVGVVLAAREYSPDNALRQTTTLTSGDVITGTWEAFGPDGLTIKTAWSPAVRLPLRQVVRMDTRNGRLTYLSDLTPARVEQVPYFDRIIPFRVDRSLTGGKLKMSDGDFSKGIAMHSRCVLHYDVAGRYEKFRSRLGFQAPEGASGEAAVRVLGDGKTLFEEADLRGDQKPRSIDLNIAGVKRLTLEVDFGQGQDVADHVVWGSARLLRGESQ